MQAHGLSSYKSLRLDDSISGSDYNRPGFMALNRDALSDSSVSHVFFYKRDRFARPDDAMEAAQIEKKLLYAGITVVTSDGVTQPMRRGEQNIVRDIELLLPYYQSGEEIRKLAERIIDAQLVLANNGFRVGGNAPYGFVRVLVDAQGNILEELARGKVVRQQGCHVSFFPLIFSARSREDQRSCGHEFGPGLMIQFHCRTQHMSPRFGHSPTPRAGNLRHPSAMMQSLQQASDGRTLRPRGRFVMAQ